MRVDDEVVDLRLVDSKAFKEYEALNLMIF